MEKRTTGLCPNCGKHLTPYFGFAMGSIYECKNCGYRGPITMTKEAKK